MTRVCKVPEGSAANVCQKSVGVARNQPAFKMLPLRPTQSKAVSTGSSSCIIVHFS